jgi:hypothetical protein
MSTTFLEVAPTSEAPSADIQVGSWYRLENDHPVRVRALRTFQGARQAEIGTQWTAVWIPCSWLFDAGELLGRLNTERVCLSTDPATHPRRSGG